MVRSKGPDRAAARPAVSLRVVVREAAETEIAEAVAWYEARRPTLGRDLLEVVDRALHQIVERPESWPSWLAERPYRRYLVRRFPFVIFYTVEPTEIAIVAFAHSKRKPGYWLKREQR